MKKHLFIILLLLTKSVCFGQIKKIESFQKKLLNEKFENANNILKEDLSEFDVNGINSIKYLFYGNKKNPNFNADSSYIYLKKVEWYLTNEITKDETIKYCDKLKICPSSFENLEIQLIEAAYNCYSKKNTLEGYYYFDSLYSNNKNNMFIVEVKEKIEKFEYDNVIISNKLSDYRWFLRKYPNSYRYSKKILTEIEKIEFQKLNENFNEKAYIEFIEEFPNSTYNRSLKIIYSKQIFDQINNSTNINDKINFLELFSDYHDLKIDSLWTIIKKDVTQFQLTIIIDKPLNVNDILSFAFENKMYLDTSSFIKLENKINSDILKNLNGNLKYIDQYEKVFGNNIIYDKLDSLKLRNDFLEISNTNIKELESYIGNNYTKLKQYDLLSNLKSLSPIEIEQKRTGFGFYDKGYGFVNLINNNIEIFPMFQEVRPFKNGYSAVKHNNYWGFIDTEGTVIIPIIYDEVKDFYDNFCCVKNDGLWEILDRDGFKINETKFQSIGHFNSGLINVKSLTKGWGYMDTNGNIVKQFIYRNATPFNDGYAIVSENDEFCLIDKKFNVIDIEKRDSPFFKNLEQNCYQIWEATPKRWIYCEPNAGEANWTPSYIFKVNEKIIINDIFQFNLNSKGLSLVPFELKESKNNTTEKIKKRFDIVNTSNGYGYFIDEKTFLGNQSSYEHAEPFINDRAVVKVSDKYLLIDSTGQQIGDVYNYIKRINLDLFIINVDDPLYNRETEYLINKDGEILSNGYNKISEFIFDNKLIVELNNKYGAINLKGNELISPKFEFISGFNKGKAIAIITKDCGYKNRKSLCNYYIIIDEKGIRISEFENSEILFSPDYY